MENGMHTSSIGFPVRTIQGRQELHESGLNLGLKVSLDPASPIMLLTPVVAAGRGQSGRSMKKELDILIIEDVLQDAELIEEELRQTGLAFRARRTENRPGFLAELDRNPPDIILSDFTLPEFDAFEALQLLRRLHLDIPFILVTGTRSEEVAVECIREGADDYILKASLRRLPTSISNALKKKATEQARLEAESALRRSEEQ
ncbi:MAG TPA: response regulator, partial [Candidatus Saccharimonadales bacterium]|nr:response regulator [Candidatus Saccharimonadales bacterium]